jgi:ATP-dependent helicase/nuclease subunit A
VTVLPDDPARRRIREDLDTTLVVEAAAGTGKTTALVSRIVALVRSGRATLQGLIAVTFTEKAAGEMKLRLRTEIERARAGLPALAERARLDQALAELELAHIGTIHALCADLLRERPIEAQVDPSFEVVAGDDQARLYGQAFDRWFERVLADPPEGVRRVLRRRDREGPRSILREAGTRLLELRGFDAPWRRDPFDRDRALDRIVARIAELVPLSKAAVAPDDWLARALAALARWVEELQRREELRPRDHDGLEAELRELALEYRNRFWNWKGRGEPFGATITRADALALRAAIKAELDATVARCDADLAPCLREELRPLAEEYEGLKTSAGKLDFIDLLVRTRDLLRASPEVRRDLQRRFSQVLVDEFQDTDPLQAEILVLLAGDDPTESDWTRVHPRPGKLFVVGDPKQSIYRFRRADLALYETVKDRLRAGGAEVLFLTASFRGVPPIQEAVNAAFAPQMVPGPSRSQAQYAPLDPVRPPIPGQPAVVALPIPAPYKDDWGDLKSGKDLERSNADAIASFIDWLVRSSGWQVSDRQGPGRLIPVEARHVCLLFRRLQSFGEDTTRQVVRALEARRIPHVLVGGRGYGEREEVQAVRNALTAIEWPDDELSVYATLRGPFFSLSDAQLLVWRHAGHALHPLAPAVRATLTGEGQAAAQQEVAEALALLARLHRGRNRRPIADTVTRLLDATRAHAGIAIWPTGEQALANVLRVVDLARRFEAGGASSFRGFVDRLHDQAERQEAAEAPVLEDGSDGVRIMTVHKAKGLEFPVVVLADPTVSHTGRPSRHIEGSLCVVPLAGCIPAELAEREQEALQRDRDESVRLTYVAATRARDLLVVPAVGDQPLPGWVDVLHPALYPPPERQRHTQPAPGCPPFGPDTLQVRPLRGPRDVQDAVAPGLHTPRAGSHQVVWWDPAVLALGTQDEVGLRQSEILKEDEGRLTSDSSIRAHQAWHERQARTRLQGARPTLVVRTVTELAETTPTTGQAAVRVEMVDGARGSRPHGKRFGTLVHAVLADIPFAATPPQVVRAATVQGRYLGATAPEIAAAGRAVSAALAHPLLRRAAEAERQGEGGERCRREAPVVLRLPDGTLADGIVDLAFLDGGAWTVVDFKTDRELDTRRAVYLDQVELYARAISAAMSAPAQAVLLCV